MKHIIGKVLVVLGVMLAVTACSMDKGTKEYNQGVAALKSGDYQKAYELIGKAISKNTEEPLYYINYGTALVQLARYDEAVSSYQKAISTGVEQENLENNKRAYRGLGIACYYQKKYDESEKYLKKALEISELPDLNMDAYLYLGAVQEMKNDMQNAMVTYGSALSLDNTKISAYAGKYKAETALGMYDEAEDTLRAGLRQEPKTVEDKYMYARLQFYNKEYEDSVAAFEEAKETYVESYLYLGQIYMQQDEYDKAIESFSSYTDNGGNVDNLVLCKQFAKCYMKQEKYKKAVTWLDSGAELDASDAQLQDLRYDQITAYEKLEDTTKALKLAKKYADIYTNDDRFANKVEELEKASVGLTDSTVQ